ncbi:MAG TPA: DUF5696 domain-containing protein [Terriglobia bacterium]|nr:DUF5696 domain-containing protein [Terriglobia bacterium]
MRARFYVLFALFAAGTLAYEPPVDTAGPLTVRIEQPTLGSYGAGGRVQFDQPDARFNLNVQLSSTADRPLQGTLRVRVIDRWRVKPDGAVPFTIRPRGHATVAFQVSFGSGTYNALYPIHALAEFEFEGRRLVAHPILIVSTTQANIPRAALPIEWKPVPVPVNHAMGLWRLPVRREHCVVSAEPPQSGASGQEVFQFHPNIQFPVHRGIVMTLGPRPPSLRERVDACAVEYPLALPQYRPLVLRFSAAAPGGALFRVRALPFDAPAEEEGATLLEKRVTSAAGEEVEADLASCAGRKVRLQLESAGDAGQVYWVAPTLVAGKVPAPPEFPPPANAPSRLLGTVQGFEVRMYPGSRGALDSAIELKSGERRLLFHGFRIQVLGDDLANWSSASEFLEAHEEAASGHYRVRHHFRSWAGAFDVLTEMRVDSHGLQARFRLENAPPARPWLRVYLQDVAAGPWTERAVRIYGGPGNVIQDPQAFRLSFDGHNLATSFVGFDFANGVSLLQGVDAVPDRLEVDPQNHTYTLVTPHTQTITFLPAANVWEAVKLWRMNELRAAPGVSKLAGRFVFDLWGGRYASSAQALQRAFRYGLTDTAVVWHNWQRWGYDFRLPDIYPPNPQLGTLQEFQKLVETCREHGVLFAPHDNYIDLYPDAEGFSYENVTFQSNGQPERAWYHAERDAQSYRARPDRLRPMVERNLDLIRAGFSPTAYFIDVWSSAPPYDFWTQDGRFVERSVTRQVWGETFAWIRDSLGDNAPQISEAGHDRLIGWLDGAQANILRVDAQGSGFVWRIHCADAERIPWIDAAYHDRFVLHGAGYEDRYAAGLDLATHGMYSDDYMATEMLTGHPAMVEVPFSRDVVRKYWLLHDVMRALALRRIESVEFGAGDIHRQHVTWDNGAEVWVNRGASDWRAGGHTLPPYGFYARAPLAKGMVETAIERQTTGTVEWSRSPGSYYYNSRHGAAYRLIREGETWRVVAAPDSAAFTARVPWTGPSPAQATAIDENGTQLRQVPIRREGGAMILAFDSKTFAYALR